MENNVPWEEILERFRWITFKNVLLPSFEKSIEVLIDTGKLEQFTATIDYFLGIGYTPNYLQHMSVAEHLAMRYQARYIYNNGSSNFKLVSPETMPNKLHRLFLWYHVQFLMQMGKLS